MSIRGLYFACLVVVGVLAYAGTSQANGGFSLKSLDGTYVFSGSGTLGFGTVQASIVGLTTFDRAGGCNTTAQLNLGGTVTPLTTATCSYTVNADGTGTQTVTFNEPPFGPFKSDLAIVNQEEIHFILSDEGTHSTVAIGIAKRQRGGRSDN